MEEEADKVFMNSHHQPSSVVLLSRNRPRYTTLRLEIETGVSSAHSKDFVPSARGGRSTNQNPRNNVHYLLTHTHTP
ncbi:hypothetical protein BC937DRAFT_90358 [Endogone sp. FLAS-F59071]|nr:hypothetical protein BC937DRAFT_90358 [Endogone sp. FLAS-F59071]|eukprot:RUS17152.1 hypothetical protein BC937DRAFT_90358 [Endogone sp. FLAS-F59071]